MVLSGLIANVGLAQLLEVTLPVVVALHPIAIALLLIAPLRHQLSQAAVLTVVATATAFGCIDAAHILGVMPTAVDNVLTAYLPLYHYYAGWVLPTVVVLVIGWVVSRMAGYSYCIDNN